MKNLKNIVKMVTKENEISGNEFYIGNGGLIFHNLYIPIDAISVVKLLQLADEPLKPYIIGIIVGIVICFCGFPIGLLIGLIVAVFFGWLLFSTIQENKNKVFKLLIKLNNGDTYTIAYGKLDFAVNIVNEIRKCVSEKNKVQNLHVVNGDIFNINDSSVGKVCGNIFGGDIEKFSINNTNRGKDKVNEVNEEKSDLSKLTNAEWDELVEFFIGRQIRFAETSIEYEDCEKLLGFAKNKDDEKVHVFIRKLVRDKRLDIIIGTGEKAKRIIEILRKA